MHLQVRDSASLSTFITTVQQHPGKFGPNQRLEQHLSSFASERRALNQNTETTEIQLNFHYYLGVEVT